MPHLVLCENRNICYRRRVPKYLKERYGKEFIIHTVHTDGKKQAARIEPSITVFLNNFFWELTNPDGLYKEYDSEQLQRFVNHEIEQLCCRQIEQLILRPCRKNRPVPPPSPCAPPRAAEAAPAQKPKDLNRLLQAFLEYNSHVKNLKPATLNRHFVSLSRIAQILKAQEPRDLDKDALIGLDRELSRCMKPASVKTYLAALLSFFNYCQEVERVKIPEDALKTLKDLKGCKADESSRTLFTDEELRKIFSPALSNKPVHYYAPIIALTCGLRVSEIAALTAGDVLRTPSGVCYISVRRGKTKNALRDVPVPKALLRTGFLDYVKTAASGGSRLWAYHPCSISQHFSQYLKDLNIKDESKVFHSLRHNYTSALYAANVSDYYVNALVGHTQKTTAQTTYTHLTADDFYKNGVSRLDFSAALVNLRKRPACDG